MLIYICVNIYICEGARTCVRDGDCADRSGDQRATAKTDADISLNLYLYLYPYIVRSAHLNNISISIYTYIMYRSAHLRLGLRQR